MSTNKQQSNDVLSAETNAQLEERERALQLEERELDLEIKRHTVAQIRAVKQAILDKNRAQQQAISQFLANRRAVQANCNHRKGGVGHEAVIRGAGTSAMYAVIKHRLPCGKFFVLCQRCGKEWFPELTALQNAGVPRKATKGYWDAMQFQTNNSESGSSQFTFSQIEASLGEEGDD
jgi:hypothetical protein